MGKGYLATAYILLIKNYHSVWEEQLYTPVVSLPTGRPQDMNNLAANMCTVENSDLYHQKSLIFLLLTPLLNFFFWPPTRYEQSRCKPRYRLLLRKTALHYTRSIFNNWPPTRYKQSRCKHVQNIAENWALHYTRSIYRKSSIDVNWPPTRCFIIIWATSLQTCVEYSSQKKQPYTIPE